MYIFIFGQNCAKKIKRSISTPQPEYELAVSFAKQLLQSSSYKHYKSDIYAHFSNILSTKSNKISVTKHNYREIVTFQQRYPCCKLKIVPRFDGAAALKSESSVTSTAKKSMPDSDEEVEEADRSFRNANKVSGSHVYFFDKKTLH